MRFEWPVPMLFERHPCWYRPPTPNSAWRTLNFPPHPKLTSHPGAKTKLTRFLFLSPRIPTSSSFPRRPRRAPTTTTQSTIDRKSFAQTALGTPTVGEQLPKNKYLATSNRVPPNRSQHPSLPLPFSHVRSAYPLYNTPCTHLIRDNMRFLVFPEYKVHLLSLTLATRLHSGCNPFCFVKYRFSIGLMNIEKYKGKMSEENIFVSLSHVKTLCGWLD